MEDKLLPNYEEVFSRGGSSSAKEQVTKVYGLTDGTIPAARTVITLVYVTLKAD